ncbi:uncharacterized protein LOC116345506 isoform X2 [Contarinia nasturtii]|nr:uncharacterized protein LOC116345506 isoform X2 [Contarinia nasturtii]XP_031630791.1 uncharacterized protein LOC116345506 isoform X2 [Contarinia nasturtii]XP_031630792.1 uncharacterized protein LOC116345506 isoform X2 [Contarinia nasturtii]XP_031630793.1 uncharacterized protein LOC116345506 isoform X2 [Contarinia nasturtii]
MTSTKITDYDINKPDNLLADLKKTLTKTTNHLSSKASEKDVGIDSGLLEPHLNGVKTVRTETTTTDNNVKPSNRSVLGSPSLVRKVMNESRIRGQSPTPKEHEIKFDKFDQSPKLTREVKFETEPVLDSIPKATTTRTYNYSKTTSTTRNATPLKTEIVEMDTTDLPAELKNAPISSDLLPQPGTKVTTTIKTYSYQIPDDTKVPENLTFKNEYYNSEKSSNTYYPDSGTPPGSKKTIYSSETRNTSKQIIPPIPDTVGPHQTKYYYKKEVNETKNNVYAPPPLPPSNNTTTWYERNETKTNDVFHPPSGITSYTQNVSQNDNLPPGTKQTYLYKKETTNTTNTLYEPPPPPEPKTEKYYKYSSTTTTTNTHNRPEREPILGPFPTDGIHQTQVDEPPKNLNQLMATFEEENVNVDEEPYVPRKEINTALATNKNAPSKNVTGAPVYYPPGKELFAKSEAQGALRAGGGFGKGSGKYEYEAESKSKKASKSGGAVVPVCLPLCCAMPCSIM